MNSRLPEGPADRKPAARRRPAGRAYGWLLRSNHRRRPPSGTATRHRPPAARQRPGPAGLLLPGGGELLLRRPAGSGGRQHRSPRAHDRRADRLRCAPDRGHRPVPDQLRRHRAAQRQEQNSRCQTGIANPLASIERYDTVLLGSPIWNVRPPMIMTTFTESHDFTGKTVHPFVTYAVSGLGSTERDYTASCPGARIGARPGGPGRRGHPAPRRRRDLASHAGLRTT